MDSVLAILFDERDDFQLVDALAVSIENSPMRELPHAQKVVSIVWSASGLIGNGGFQAYFCSDTDPVQLIQALEEIGAVEAATSVRNGMSSAVLNTICEFTNLKSLTLDGTQVSSEGLDHLTSLHFIETLSVGKTAVDDSGLKHIGKLTTLTDLGLDDTKVTDSGMKQLRNLRSLRRLSCDETQISDASIPTLLGFTEIRDLYYPSEAISSEGRELLKKALIHWESG